MARSHAIVHSSILESDLSERSIGAQLLYRQLLERPERGTLGVISYRPASWCKYLPGLDRADVEALVDELEDHDFLVVDRDELELIHRTHMHHDGVLKQPQVLMAAAKARTAVESVKIGAAIDDQIPPALRDRWPTAIAKGEREVVRGWMKDCDAASYKAPNKPKGSLKEALPKPSASHTEAIRKALGMGTGTGSGLPTPSRITRDNSVSTHTPTNVLREPAKDRKA